MFTVISNQRWSNFFFWISSQRKRTERQTKRKRDSTLSLPLPAGWRRAPCVLPESVASQPPRVAVHCGGDHLCRHQRRDAASVRHHLLQDHHCRLLLVSAHHESWLHHLSDFVERYQWDILLFSQVFAEPDQEIVRQRSTLFSLLFAAIGGVSFVTMFLQVCMFNTLYCTITIYVLTEKSLG